jgi:hypothetical protein
VAARRRRPVTIVAARRRRPVSIVAARRHWLCPPAGRRPVIITRTVRPHPGTIAQAAAPTAIR